MKKGNVLVVDVLSLCEVGGGQKSCSSSDKKGSSINGRE